MWRRVDERTKPLYTALFSILSKLPKILLGLREPRQTIEGNAFLHEQVLILRHDLRVWRENPEYVNLFHTSTLQTCGFPGANLCYKSNKAVSLLLTCAAMMILINAALLLLSDSEMSIFRQENLMLAKQICQSYECSRKFSPVGSLAMDFAFHVAYLVPNEQLKGWIVEKLSEMASPLGAASHTGVIAAELENCFDYLRY